MMFHIFWLELENQFLCQIRSALHNFNVRLYSQMNLIFYNLYVHHLFVILVDDDTFLKGKMFQTLNYNFLLENYLCNLLKSKRKKIEFSKKRSFFWLLPFYDFYIFWFKRFLKDQKMKKSRKWDGCKMYLWSLGMAECQQKSIKMIDI